MLGRGAQIIEAIIENVRDIVGTREREGVILDLSAVERAHLESAAAAHGGALGASGLLAAAAIAGRVAKSLLSAGGTEANNAGRRVLGRRTLATAAARDRDLRRLVQKRCPELASRVEAVFAEVFYFLSPFSNQGATPHVTSSPRAHVG